MGQSWWMFLALAAFAFVITGRFFWTGNFVFDSFYGIVPRPLFAIVCCWIIGNATIGFKGTAKRVFENKRVAYLGKISYAMYLFHNFVPGMLMGMTWPEAEFLRAVIFFASTVFLAALSWKVFEGPINGLKRKWTVRTE